MCGNENVILKTHEGTGELIQYDKQSERPHVCSVKSVYCPLCKKRFPQNRVCEHYQKLNYTPGENEAFFIRNILNPPRPKFDRKQIGTSAGNTRTKKTECKICNKDLNGYSYERIEKHKEEHEKEKGQAKLW